MEQLQTSAPPESKGRVAALYERLAPRRQPFLDRARLCSRYTIPSLIPEDGTNSSTDLYKPFQSIGARGVNNLASKLLLTLLAPTRRFFRLKVEDKLWEQVAAESRSDWELALSRAEERITNYIETLGLRTHAFEAMRHLVVSGNVLLFIDKDGSRVFDLRQYVVRRSPQGHVLEIVVKECIAREDIPESVEEMVKPKLRDNEKNIDLYTHVYLDKRTWRVSQEIKGIEVPESRGTYPKDKCPWLALRWTRLEGEDYGRGHCDDYLGDLLACETLSRSITRASAIAAKVVFLVSPNGQTDPTDLQDAEEGDFVDGNAEDVTALGLEKHYDFQIAQAMLEKIEARLSYAFLLNSAIRRQGERVTAEEIRYMASELEDALGGVYSVLSLEFQLPIVQVVMSVMQRAGMLPPFPDKTIRPTIITGIDALGRSHELARLDAFIGGALQTFGPQVMMWINMSDYLKRRAAGLDIDPKGLIKTDQELQAEMSQMQQQSLMEKVAAPVATGLTKALTTTQ